MKSLKRPRVILVGAGPGDPGLLTLAGRSALQNADVVFYDALVSDEILKDVPVRKRIFVGKRGGRPSPAQEQINRRLAAAAKKCGAVIRLKGGDPFVFGRGGEEAEFLRKKGVSVNVVPGISSGLAAATYAGFPLTDRRHASSVTLMTATPAASGAAVNYRSLVGLGGTWVFFMGLKALPDIVRSLLRAGADPRLPAAVISRATTPFQRVVTAPLSTIFNAASRHRLEPPALTIVGRVVSLRPPPLRGKAILVLRPEHQSGKLSGLLRQNGAVVAEFPILDIVPIQPNPALLHATRRLEDYDWILLTSGNSVRILKSFLCSPRRRARIAAVGPGTGEALRELRLYADLIPEKDFRAEGLADAFSKRGGGRRTILLPQAQDARDMLARHLKQAGHRVDVVPIYQTLINRRLFGKIAKWVNEVEDGLVPLTSASMAKALSAATVRRAPSIGRPRLVSIGPITTEAATRAGLRIAAESPSATLADLIATLETVA